MKSEILKFCMEKGLLLDKDVCEILSSLEDKDAKEVIDRISHLKAKIITKSFFYDNALKLKEIIPPGNRVFEKLSINLDLSIEISREIKLEKEEKKENKSIKVLSSVMYQMKKLKVTDFVKYFRIRFSEMRAILQSRPELENLISINKINGERQAFSIIGMIYNKRITKNKNLLLEVEDLTGKIRVIVNQNKPDLYEKARDLVSDIVVGIRGTGNKEFLFANEIIFPDTTLPEKINLARDESIAFTSDIHVGSKMFLEKNFRKFIEWLNGDVGDERQREESRKVKYLLITGDTVDGIGVYPGQEDLLNIKDIKSQYVKLAEMLSKIRKDVTIVMCPGQHDAVRVAEPQPSVGKEYAGAMHELENVILVSNPALIEIPNSGRRGIKILMYHGASMNSIINEVDSLRSIRAHDTPSKVVKYLLKVGHLAPIHSSVTYIPDERQDDLSIKEVPDIITTADLHKPDVDTYNNILIVCSSCWQSITPFEEKVGNHPDPCKVPILNLKTKQIKILDFSDIGQEQKCEEKDRIVCEVNSGEMKK